MLCRHALGLFGWLACATLVIAGSACSSTPTLATADAAVEADANVWAGDGGGGFQVQTWADLRSVPAPCGLLDPTTASQLVLTRVDDVLLPAAEALAMIDTSNLFTGNAVNSGSGGSTPHPGSDLKTAVNNLADDLSDQWLLASNVESADGGEVTYLLTTNGQDGGSEAGSACGLSASDNSVRLRVSRINCTTADTVEVEILFGTEETRLLAFELDANRIVGRLFPRRYRQC